MIKEYVVKVTNKVLPNAFTLFEEEYSPELELVRCKECKWSKTEKVFKNVPTSKDMVRWCKLITRYVDDDWFCADGERPVK